MAIYSQTNTTMIHQNKKCQTCSGSLYINITREVTPIYEIGSVKSYNIGRTHGAQHCSNVQTHDTGWTFDEKFRIVDKELYDREQELKSLFFKTVTQAEERIEDKFTELKKYIDGIVRLNRLKLPEPAEEEFCEEDYRYDERD